MGRGRTNKSGKGAGRAGTQPQPARSNETPLPEWLANEGPLKTVQDVEFFVSEIRQTMESQNLRYMGDGGVSVFRHKVMISDLADAIGVRDMAAFKAGLNQSRMAGKLTLSSSNSPRQVDPEKRRRSEIVDGETTFHFVAR